MMSSFTSGIEDSIVSPSIRYVPLLFLEVLVWHHNRLVKPMELLKLYTFLSQQDLHMRPVKALLETITEESILLSAPNSLKTASAYKKVLRAWPTESALFPDYRGVGLWLTRGGWPVSVGEKESVTLRWMYDYVDAVINIDVSHVDGVENPLRQPSPYLRFDSFQ